MPGTGPIRGNPSLVVSNVPAQRNSISSLAAPEGGELSREQGRFLLNQTIARGGLNDPFAVFAADNDPSGRRRSRIEVFVAVFPDQRAIFPDVLRLRWSRDRP